MNYCYTCIYNSRKFSNDTESEALIFYIVRPMTYCFRLRLFVCLFVCQLDKKRKTVQRSNFEDKLLMSRVTDSSFEGGLHIASAWTALSCNKQEAIGSVE